MALFEKEHDEIVEKYNAQTGFSPVEETDTEPPADTEEETTEPLAETQEEAEPSDETEEAEEEPQEEEEPRYEAEEEVKDEQEKMVPYGALHEEREKRKGLSKKVGELEGQLHSVLQDYRKLSETRDEETEEYSDPEIASLRREIAELRQFKDQLTQKDQAQTEMARQQEHARNVQMTDEKLEKEGFPGFVFATDPVGVEIARLVREDPENAYLYSPGGWEKVYKEIVYPKIKSKFTSVHKDELFDKKKTLKSGQKLVGKTGKKPAPEKSDKDWSYEDYMKFRRSHSIA